MNTSGHEQSSGLSAPPAPKPVRVAVLVIEAALVLAIGWQLVGLFTGGAADSDTAGPGVPQRPRQTGAHQVADISRLTSFDPFFRATPVVPQEGTMRAPESSLKLSLFGLRAMQDGQGSAIVKMEDADQKLVRVGDAIAPGIRLVGVYTDRLEISRAGTREAVYLRPKSATSAQAAAPRRPGAAPAPSGRDGKNTGLLASLTGLKLEPVRRERRIIGFRLPEDTPFLLTAMGLQAGDILTAANGSPLTSFERIAELSDELAGASRVELTLERRGEQRTLAIGL